MKTAMQMALDRIEMLYIEKDSVHWEMFKNDCMEKEKEQIMNAYIEGYTSWDSEMSGFEYYTKTHNKNK